MKTALAILAMYLRKLEVVFDYYLRDLLHSHEGN